MQILWTSESWDLCAKHCFDSDFVVALLDFTDPCS